MNLIHLSRAELRSLVTSWGESNFRADQIYDWIWSKKVFDFDQMLNLSKAFREKLKAEASITPPNIVFEQKSSDGTIKYLIRLEDDIWRSD